MNFLFIHHARHRTYVYTMLSSKDSMFSENAEAEPQDDSLVHADINLKLKF
jgi:hypothetical protein